jgi:hypothetical protein
MITRATEIERQQYHGVYPLYGWIRWKGQRLAVEDCSGGPAGDPRYEVMAPEGYHFGASECHSLLGYNQKDAQSRLQGECLEPCTEMCG